VKTASFIDVTGIHTCENGRTRNKNTFNTKLVLLSTGMCAVHICCSKYSDMFIDVFE